MVHQNALELYGYAQLILAAYHTDELALDKKGTTGQVSIATLWSYDMRSVSEELYPQRELGGPEGFQPEDERASDLFDSLYPGLRDKQFVGKPYSDYNATPEYMHQLEVFLVQGSRDDLLTIWYNMQQDLKSGPEGGDDTTFDYWPSAFGLWVHMGYDLMSLGVTEAPTAEAMLSFMRRTWHQAADAVQPWTGYNDFDTEITKCP